MRGKDFLEEGLVLEGPCGFTLDVPALNLIYMLHGPVEIAFVVRPKAQFSLRDGAGRQQVEERLSDEASLVMPFLRPWIGKQENGSS